MTDLPQISSRDEIIEILRVGLQAVSPYNAQPWEFRLNDHQLLIFVRHVERSFWKHKKMLHFLLGAFLENLAEGAKHWHYEITYTPVHNPDLNMTKPFCEVIFRKTSATAEYPIQHVLSRYTNRKIYHPKPLSPLVFENMKKIFDGPTCKVLDLTGQKDFFAICGEIEKIRITNPQLRDEISSNICYTAEESKQRKRGLDIRTLELPLRASIFMRLNRNRFFRGTIGKGALPQFFVKEAHQKQLSGAPLLVAFIEHDQDKMENLIHDWMAIQKILNTLTKDGLSSHLVSSSLDIAKINKIQWGKEETKIIGEGRAAIKKMYGFEVDSFLTLLRVGYADECRFRSLRKDPEELFWNQND